MHYQRWKTHGDPMGPPKRSEICAIPGCGKPRRTLEWCLAHYSRFLRHGDPLGGGPPVNGASAKYLAETVLPYRGDDCLLWPFARSDNGYALITRHRTPERVGRIVCEAVNGPPPPGQRYDSAHSCGNGKIGCVTPGHLSWKTRRQNMADTLVHGTRLRGEGHPSSKLTEAQVREIRSLQGKVSAESLALRFAVSPYTIVSIHSRQNWGWMTD